jgi:hypothetical protein
MNQIILQEEIEYNQNPAIACYHLVQNILFSYQL